MKDDGSGWKRKQVLTFTSLTQSNLISGLLKIVETTKTP